GGAGSAGSGQGSGGAGGGEQDPLQQAITGAAIFKGDRLVGYLDDQEARGLLWLRNELQTGFLTITLGEPGHWVSLELVSGATRLEPRFRDGRIVMGVMLDAVLDVVDNAAGVDTEGPRMITLLEEEAAEAIAVRVREVGRRLQQDFGSDAAGFGLTIQRRDPR